MRILLAGKYVPTGSRPIGGVQSWIKAVADELRRRWHEVTLWGPEFGAPAGEYDLGIMANFCETAAAFPLCRRTLLVSHGIIAPEKPEGADAYAFTSEGVRAHWGGTGPVVRQPIDLRFWSREHYENAGTLLRYSYRAGLPFLPSVAAGLGLRFEHLRNATHEQAREAIHRAACVIATGRAALEAMACGAPVVICDHRSAYQGALYDPDTLGAMERNYSGRGGIEPTVENIAAAVKAAIAHGSLRRHVEEHHDATRVVDQLLEAAC
ncbi:MAG: glycosyltransferase [Sinimarinibacterium flocculans]|uniref:glycosyltransferase n=1 Tax=Sinimarinibacterium flocculans TaxID=985250 RepID=UPI003C340347